MTKKEKKAMTLAIVRLMRHIQSLQKQIKKPERSNATDEEVIALLKLLWEWTPQARYALPSKSAIENLVGLMRGCDSREYCYISRSDVARIIRKAKDEMGIIFSKDSEEMNDVQLHNEGRWNYVETPLVDLLWNLHCNPSMFNE